MPVTTPVFAIVTPMDAAGRLDKGALTDYLDFLFLKGVRTIAVGGTTGEFPSLDLNERTALFNSARRAFRGCVINNVSGCCLSDVQKLTATSEGADALLALPPYYFAAPDEGVRAFFRQAFENLSTPLYLYNFPKHTGVTLHPQLVDQIKNDLPTLRGIKDSGGAFEASCAFRAVGPDFEIYVGRDTMALPALERGLSGSVTGASNGVPEYLINLTQAWQSGDRAGAQTAQETFDVWNAFRRDLGDEIALVKYVLSLRLKGFPQHLRAPLRPLPEKTKETVRTFLKEQRLV